MDRGFAILVLNACYRASSEIGQLVPMAADHATEDEVNQLRSEIGMAVGEIGQITDTIYKLHPDLYSYVETQVETYGRVS